MRDNRDSNSARVSRNALRRITGNIMRFFMTWFWVAATVAVNMLTVFITVGSQGGHGGSQWGVTVTPLVMAFLIISLIPALGAPLAYYIGSQRGVTGWAKTGLYSLGILATLVNLMNVVKIAAELRSEYSDSRRGVIESAERRQSRDAWLGSQIETLRGVTQGDIPGVIRGHISKLKSDPLYARSGQCGDVTKTDSGRLCEMIANAQSKLAAAEKIERLEDERRGLGLWSATVTEAVPQSADPQIATISAIGQLFTQVNDNIIRAGVIGLIAIAFELLCTFGPSMVDSHYRRREGRPELMPEPATVSVTPKPKRQPRPKKIAPPKPEPRQIAADMPLIAEARAWASERLSERDGDKVKAGLMQQDFAAWCESKGHKLPNSWPNQWAAAMAALGYEKRGRKEGSAYVVYANVALKGQKPALQVVG